MYILDAVIIVGIIIFVMGGLRKGFVKSLVELIGFILILVLSFYFKNPLSTYFYKTLPFFTFKSLGIPRIYNILLYEIISFIAIFSVLMLAFRIILKISGIIEKVFNLTIVLGFISKIGGALIGFIEGYIIMFIIVFVLSQPFINITGVDESKLVDIMITKTPILKSTISDAQSAIEEVNELRIKYNNDQEKYNDEAIDIFIKYDIISSENLNILIKKGKITYK